jgi:hypothetical protein
MHTAARREAFICRPRRGRLQKRQTIMDMNNIGKYEMLQIVNEFDATLIRLYGVNMLDAAITRYEALNAYDEIHCPRKAAEIFGQRHGLHLLAA